MAPKLSLTDFMEPMPKKTTSASADIKSVQEQWVAQAYLCYEQGDVTGALETLQHALTQSEPTPLMLNVAAKIAMEIGAPEFAERLLSILLQIEPGDEQHYLNLMSCYMRGSKYDEAIELGQHALSLFPESAALWNSMGVITRQYLHDHDNAKLFFEEAIRRDPFNTSALCNLADCYGTSPKSIALYQDALLLDPENHKARVNLAINRLQSGHMRMGWHLYESRLQIRDDISKHVDYEPKLPSWQGQDLSGKTILLWAEQGIGDEVLFASIYAKVVSTAKKVIISCDPRLLSIYQRSFKKAIVVAYEDKWDAGKRTRHLVGLAKGMLRLIDFSIPIGSLPQYFWHSLEDVKDCGKPYLVSDKALSRKMADRLAKEAGESRPLKIGISWRSGKLTAGRVHGYWSLDLVKRFVAFPQATFVNLQYGAEQEELDAIQAAAGGNFISLPDADLFSDIEANLAIMDNLDLVIGPAVSTQMFAAAMGASTWIVAKNELPWWNFGAMSAEFIGHEPKPNMFKSVFASALHLSLIRNSRQEEWEDALLERFEMRAAHMLSVKNNQGNPPA